MVLTSARVPGTYTVITDLIGSTPLIRLRSFEAGLSNVELYAKAEWHNPGGSVKDRAAARMIADGERAGLLTHDKIILDATSGNTGIAYAFLTKDTPDGNFTDLRKQGQMSAPSAGRLTISR